MTARVAVADPAPMAPGRGTAAAQAPDRDPTNAAAREERS